MTDRRLTTLRRAAAAGDSDAAERLRHELRRIAPPPPPRSRLDRVWDYLWNSGDPRIDGLDHGECAVTKKKIVVGDWNDRYGTHVMYRAVQQRPLPLIADSTTWEYLHEVPTASYWARYYPVVTLGPRYVIDDTPSRAAQVLERLGVEIGWSDSYLHCECGRLQPTDDPYRQDYWIGDGDYCCEVCVEEERLECCGLPGRARNACVPGDPCRWQESYECHCVCNAEVAE